MREKFKKSVHKSISTLTTICLITSFVFGFPFNIQFDFSVSNNIKKKISVIEPVQADDATTTVTVRNGPPYFTVDAAEDPASASTSPVDIGKSIGFTATADDYEENDYYLLICDSTASAATTTGVAPHCVNGSGVIDDSLQLCVSGSTATSSQASCTYNNVADNGTEMQNWEAYICDNHSSEPECSETPNTGTGDSGSPMYLNHYPKLELITTTDDNNDPGALFEVTASTTDSDTEGGADVIYLDVCSTDSWATSTGCTARTYCATSSVATSSSVNLSCNFIASSTLPDTDYTYYAFVKDSHDFESGDNSVNNTYTVNNVAPTISNTVFNNASNVGLNIKGAGGTVVNTYSASVIDNNGCTDLEQATSTIFLSSVTASCSADDNNCYQMASTSCALTSCTGDTDAIANYSCTTTMKFFAIPTTVGDYFPQNWNSRITVYDEEFSNSATSPNRDVVASAALDINQAEIAYGVVKATFDTGAENASTTVVNYGNTPIDNEISGDDMESGGTSDVIGIENQEYSLTAFTYGAGATTSPTSSPALLELTIPRPTSDIDVTDEIYWGIGIPAGIHSGDYSGVNYFDVVSDNDGNWN